MMQTGDIFAIDRRIWSHVCSLGVNAAISFLVVARGTGGDNRTTGWSVNAVEGYTGISRPRARIAVDALVEAKVLAVIRAGKRPQYRIAWPGDVPGIKLSAAEKKDNKPEWIWLPNSIVDGLAGETPPIELLRQAQNIDAIRMFGNLYYVHDLRNDGGAGWRKAAVEIARYFERENIGEYGEYVVWGFPKYTTSAWPGSFIATEHCKHSGERPEEERWEGFWSAEQILQGTGLLQFVGHLVEGSGPDAEIIHPLPIRSGDGETLEKKLTVAARMAAMNMIKPGIDPNNYWAIVPVRRHLANVELVGIGRLRYRPQTAATAAWLGRAGELEKWVRAYEKLASEFTESIREAS